jgi:hypothetical protein
MNEIGYYKQGSFPEEVELRPNPLLEGGVSFLCGKIAMTPGEIRLHPFYLTFLGTN